MALPWAARLESSACSLSVSSRPSAAVGSSRRSAFTSPRSARARSTICLSPKPSVETIRSGSRVLPTAARASRAMRTLSRRGRLSPWACSVMLSAMDRTPARDGSWWMTRMPWRAMDRGSPVCAWSTARPSMRIPPDVGRTAPVMALTSVDFPAPLWPTSPMTWPAGMASDTASRAVIGPYVTVRSLMRIAVLPSRLAMVSVP